MQVKVCPLCELEVDSSLFDYHYQTEEHLLQKIATRYPAWKSQPEKLRWYYRNFVLVRRSTLR